jgi:DNA-binding LacI/PurR family transcriptional regulator
VAQRYAERLGFKLEKISLFGERMSARRVNGILKSRGIYSVILSPVNPGYEDYPELDWEAFCVVAVGYSIKSVNPHRVVPHQTKSMQTHCLELRKLGYNKIGLLLPEQVNRRTLGHCLGAYLAEQRFQPDEFRISPFLTPSDDFSVKELSEWIRANKPDCIIVPGKPAYYKVLEGGWRVPEDLGISVLGIDHPDSQIAGIDEHVGMGGEAAIDLMISLLFSNQRGIPQYPRYSMVEGSWVWKPTLRPPSQVDSSK